MATKPHEDPIPTKENLDRMRERNREAERPRKENPRVNALKTALEPFLEGLNTGAQRRATLTSSRSAAQFLSALLDGDSVSDEVVGYVTGAAVANGWLSFDTIASPDLKKAAQEAIERRMEELREAAASSPTEPPPAPARADPAERSVTSPPNAAREARAS